jgi:diaminohydroxyphosphoribosylaminopyrimidine deaminase/5-amino-6-(5-phosphoribosylamino)uracil reductase
LHQLAKRECNEVMIEAGATLAGAFWQQQCVDYLNLYIAPVLLGSDARPLLELPFTTMAQRQPLHIDAITQIGDDWRIDASPDIA